MACRPRAVKALALTASPCCSLIRVPSAMSFCFHFSAPKNLPSEIAQSLNGLVSPHLLSTARYFLSIRKALIFARKTTEITLTVEASSWVTALCVTTPTSGLQGSLLKSPASATHALPPTQNLHTKGLVSRKV